MNDLEKVKTIASEERIPLTTFYDGIKNGHIPIVQVGQGSMRVSRMMWERFKRGETVDPRFFKKPRKADKKGQARERMEREDMSFQNGGSD